MSRRLSLNRGVAGLVLLIHGLVLLAGVVRPSRDETPPSPVAVPVRLIMQPQPDHQDLAPRLAWAPPPRWSMPPAPAVQPPPSFVVVTQAQDTGVADVVAASAAAAVDAGADLSPAASRVTTGEAGAPALSPQPTAESQRLVSAALPPDHGSCSARGVARHYPAMLRERGIEGQVWLKVQVDPEGHAAEVVVQSGSGWRLLDEAARQVARSCPYLPARRGEQRLVAWVEYPVRFTLDRATP